MFYLHIPKTGGQALAQRLASAFAPGQALMRPDDFVYPQDLALLRRALEQYRFIEAHVTGEMLGEVAASDLLVTVREPVAQIVSNYRHIRREEHRPLCRAARELAPGEFFDRFGDFLVDHQTRYLLSAFHPLAELSARDGWHETALALLPAVLDKVRWLVPTDRIDRFVPLWEAEHGRKVAEQAFGGNHAPPDGLDLKELERAVRARPWLFALDGLLYRLAENRFARWSEGIEQRLRPWAFPDNASRVFADGPSGVWLRRGWYGAEETPMGPGNWAGPGANSQIELRRRPGDQDRLAFDVLVVNGITFGDICAFGTEDYRPLKLWREELGPEHWRYWIKLDSLGETALITLSVPNCYAPINVFPAGEDGGLERRSFLAAGWSLGPAKVPTSEQAEPAAAEQCPVRPALAEGLR